MDKVLVSFTTRPDRGGEGGVGWAFVRAAVEYVVKHDSRVHLVIDARDADTVKRALGKRRETGLVVVHPVALPRWAERRFGDARSRASYMAWLPGARHVVLKLLRSFPVDVVHQVTFATATLPSVLPRSGKLKRVWGPVALPFGAVDDAEHTFWDRWSSEAPLKFFRRVGLRNLRRADLVIATNSVSAAQIGLSRASPEVEPNIAVGHQSLNIVERDPHLLSLVGLLIPRKRPWIAIQALKSPGLEQFRLQVVGDGPLLPELKQLAENLGVEDRVHFLGQLGHGEALAALAGSRVLVHPAAREGAAWVIGEAAALGVPTVAFANVGCASTVLLSDNGGEVVEPGPEPSRAVAEAVQRVVSKEPPDPVSRWSDERFVGLLERWWSP